jgi:hypothetical protein
MKSIFLVFIVAIFSIHYSAAQNPLGLYIDIDGHVKFWTAEANRNGNVDDTVFVSYNGTRELIDLRNLKYNYLTLLEAPREAATSKCNLDPSARYDTTVVSEVETQFKPIGYSLTFSQLNYYGTPTIEYMTNDTSPKQNEFADDIRGIGLNDTNIKEVKTILAAYINRLKGKWEDDDDREALRKKLSLPDTIIEKKAVYDYLIDLFVVHNYDSKNRLTKVIGYHWDLGVEVDSLSYDKRGKLIYFSRDKIGSIRNEFFFKYNKYALVSDVKHVYTTVGINKHTTQYAHPEVHKMKFAYNNAGKMSAQSHLQNDGTWVTLNYEFR